MILAVLRCVWGIKLDLAAISSPEGIAARLSMLTHLAFDSEAVLEREKQRLKAPKCSSLSRGRVALLDIAQRSVLTSRSHIPAKRSPKKAVPTTPKTTGDFIRLGRYQKALNLSEMAAKLNVSASLVKAWERDVQLPTECEWKALAELLSISRIAIVHNSPTRE